MVPLALQLLIFSPAVSQAHPVARLVGDLALEPPASIADARLEPQPPPPPPPPRPAPAAEGPAGSGLGPVGIGALIYLPMALGAGWFYFHYGTVSGILCVKCTPRRTYPEIFLIAAVPYFVGVPLVTAVVVYRNSSDATGGFTKGFLAAALANVAAAAAISGLYAAGLAFELALLGGTIAAALPASWATAQFLDHGPPPAPSEPLPASQARPESPAPSRLPAPSARVVPLLSATW